MGGLAGQTYPVPEVRHDALVVVTVGRYKFQLAEVDCAVAWRRPEEPDRGYASVRWRFANSSWRLANVTLTPEATCMKLPGGVVLDFSRLFQPD